MEIIHEFIEGIKGEPLGDDDTVEFWIVVALLFFPFFALLEGVV